MRRFFLFVGVLSILATSAVATAAGKPAVRFASPKAGATTGTTVTFTVKLTNFVLDPNGVGKKNVRGHGHLHFQMDGGKFDHPKYSGANGRLAVKLGIAGLYSPSVTPSITYTHLPRGRHHLVVFLANNDHSRVGPSASIWVTVG